MNRCGGASVALVLLIGGGCTPAPDGDLALTPLRVRPEDPDTVTVKDQNDFMSSASPLGDRVLFTSQRTGDFHLWVMNVDGSDQRQLTYGPGTQMQGSWSPDGRRIVYLHMEDGVRSIAVIDADGGNLRLLTEAPRSWPVPMWSPDGTRILYHWPGASGTDDLWTVDPEGGEPELFLASPSQVRHGAWSPDGRRVVFSSRRDGADYEIYVADAGGGPWTRLTDDDAEDYTPSWSPGGRRVVFQSPRAGRWTILTVEVDGSEVEAITRYPGQYDPVWSHDGSEIFFNSDRDGRRGIYVMNADGSYPRKLTNTDPGDFVRAVHEVGVDEAARLFREAHSADPDAVFFYEREVQYLGENFMEMGDLRRARVLFEINAVAHPLSSQVHVDLGNARLAAGQIESALESFRRALEVNPEDDRVVALVRRLEAGG